MIQPIPSITTLAELADVSRTTMQRWKDTKPHVYAALVYYVQRGDHKQPESQRDSEAT